MLRIFKFNTFKIRIIELKTRNILFHYQSLWKLENPKVILPKYFFIFSVVCSVFSVNTKMAKSLSSGCFCCYPPSFNFRYSSMYCNYRKSTDENKEKCDEYIQSLLKLNSKRNNILGSRRYQNIALAVMNVWECQLILMVSQRLDSCQSNSIWVS